MTDEKTKAVKLILSIHRARNDNDVLPSAKICNAVRNETLAGFTRPSPKQSITLANELLDCLPYLERKGTDLTIFVAKLVLIFEAHSLAAARHVLDPIHGLVGREEFISLPKVNLALERFEAEQRHLIFAAEWALAEHERRSQARTQAEAFANERATFEQRHGETPLEHARRKLQ
ncbi:MAG: hypothetical protein M3O03_12560 [Pseudomonadota bacterium]|nr:hypothetical protein [Pseudomonadota bacterium]